MNTPDRSQFTLRIPVKTSSQAVYDSFTTRPGLEAWLLSRAELRDADGDVLAAGNLEQGDTFVWHWHGYSEEAAVEGRMLADDGSNAVRFTFDRNTEVEVHLEMPEAGTVIVSLTHMGLDEAEASEHYVDYYASWTFYLTNLKSVLEGGIDLRNKDTQLKGMLNA